MQIVSNKERFEYYDLYVYITLCTVPGIFLDKIKFYEPYKNMVIFHIYFTQYYHQIVNISSNINKPYCNWMYW